LGQGHTTGIAKNEKATLRRGEAPASHPAAKAEKRHDRIILKNMKTLFLLRHAKTAPGQAGQDDSDRRLTAEGRQAAERIGEFVVNDGLKITAALCSPALRARETVDLVLSAAKLSLVPTYDSTIYEGGPLALLELIAAVEDDTADLLVVGHNPALEDLQTILTGQSAHFSPGTLAKIVFETETWAELGSAKGTLQRMVSPKDL
jgi:phosphohistidine phosphatase